MRAGGTDLALYGHGDREGTGVVAANEVMVRNKGDGDAELNPTTGGAADGASRCQGISIREELKRRGVPPEFFEPILRSLVEPLSRMNSAAREGLLVGVAISYSVHKETHDGLQDSVRNLHEIERLLDSFGGELKKLDEAVKILGAFLDRMRSHTNRDSDRILH